MLAQANARITKLERSGGTAGTGFSEDWDRPASDPEAAGGAGQDKWRGGVDAYYSETRERPFGSAAGQREVVRSLVVDADRPNVDFETGDHVTFTFGGSSRSARVQIVEERRLAGIGGTTRLTLEPA